MKVAILAEGQFAPATAKTAIGVLRYAPFEVVAVVDSTQAGKDATECVGVGHGVPVVATVDEALFSARPRRGANVRHDFPLPASPSPRSASAARGSR